MRLDVARHSTAVGSHAAVSVREALRVLVRDLLSIAKRERTEVSRTPVERGLEDLEIVRLDAIPSLVRHVRPGREGRGVSA